MYTKMRIQLVSDADGVGSFGDLEERIVRLAREGILSPSIEVAPGLCSLIVKLLDRRCLWTGTTSRAIDIGAPGVGMISVRFALGGEAC